MKHIFVVMSLYQWICRIRCKILKNSEFKRTDAVLKENILIGII